MKESELVRHIQQRALEATREHFNLARQVWPDRQIPELVYWEGTEQPAMPHIPQCVLRFNPNDMYEAPGVIRIWFDEEDGALVTYESPAKPIIEYTKPAFVWASEYMFEVAIPGLVAELILMAIHGEEGKRLERFGKEWEEVMSVIGASQQAIDYFKDWLSQQSDDERSSSVCARASEGVSQLLH